MTEKIKITEEDYKKILDTVLIETVHEIVTFKEYSKDPSIRKAKEKGYLKKSKHEEAVEYYKKVLNTKTEDGYYSDISRVEFTELKNKYEEALKEKKK